MAGVGAEIRHNRAQLAFARRIRVDNCQRNDAAIALQHRLAGFALDESPSPTDPSIWRTSAPPHRRSGGLPTAGSVLPISISNAMSPWQPSIARLSRGFPGWRRQSCRACGYRRPPDRPTTGIGTSSASTFRSATHRHENPIPAAPSSAAHAANCCHASCGFAAAGSALTLPALARYQRARPRC